ncbi:hypothetical protein L195_g006441, partial [Trifolium pratense]
MEEEMDPLHMTLTVINAIRHLNEEEEEEVPTMTTTRRRTVLVTPEAHSQAQFQNAGSQGLWKSLQNCKHMTRPLIQMNMYSIVTPSSITMEHGARGAVKCKIFVLTLKESTMTWFKGLPKGSIKSWGQLCEEFTAHFTARTT